jgi:hypothetical protein
MNRISDLIGELIGVISDESEIATMEMAQAVTRQVQGMDMGEGLDDAYLTIKIAEESVRPYLARIRYFGALKADLCDIKGEYERFVEPRPAVSIEDAFKVPRELHASDLFNVESTAREAEVAEVAPIAELTAEREEQGEERAHGGGDRFMSSPDFTGGERMREIVLCAMYVDMNHNGLHGGRNYEIARATRQFMRTYELLRARDEEIVADRQVRVEKQAGNALRVLVGTQLAEELPDGNKVLTARGKSKAKDLLKKYEKGF